MKFFYKLSYEIICLIYSRVLTLVENSFLRRNFKSQLSLDKNGFLKITSKSKLNISKLRFDYLINDNEMSFFSNNYQKKIILSQDNLNSTIKLIFNRQFCNFLTSLTGFKYSIDFFGAYQNFYIPLEQIKAIGFLSPILVVILSVIFLKERIYFDGRKNLITRCINNLLDNSIKYALFLSNESFHVIP